MPEGPTRRGFAAAYWTFGVFMGAFPLVAWGLTAALGQPGKLIFAAETLGLCGFVGYWVTKSVEMRKTHAEARALEGSVAAR